MFINNCFNVIQRDNVPTLKLAEWELQCNLWNGDVLAGPVPTFFADTPDVAINALKEDIGKAHYDLNRFHRVFFEAEHVDVSEAMELVKLPR
jgi:hypothetical protein